MAMTIHVDIVSAEGAIHSGTAEMLYAPADCEPDLIVVVLGTDGHVAETHARHGNYGLDEDRIHARDRHAARNRRDGPVEVFDGQVSWPN